MKFTNSVSLNPNSFIEVLIQKGQKNRNIKMLAIFIGASLLVAGCLTAIQSATTTYKKSQCIQKKQCRCGSECSCGSTCGCS